MEMDTGLGKKLESSMEGIWVDIELFVTGPGCARACRIIAKDLRASINDRTGNLKRSVRTARLKDRNRGITIPGGKAIVTYGAYGGGKGSANHAHLLEFGTVKMPAKRLLEKASKKRPGAQHTAFIEGTQAELAKVVKAAEQGRLSPAARRAADFGF